MEIRELTFKGKPIEAIQAMLDKIKKYTKPQPQIVFDLIEDFQKVLSGTTETLVLIKRISRKHRHNLELRCLCNSVIDDLIREESEWTIITQHWQSIGKKLKQSLKSEETPIR